VVGFAVEKVRLSDGTNLNQSLDPIGTGFGGGRLGERLAKLKAGFSELEVRLLFVVLSDTGDKGWFTEKEAKMGSVLQLARQGCVGVNRKIR
jgi:hypothetical protein